MWGLVRLSVCVGFGRFLCAIGAGFQCTAGLVSIDAVIRRSLVAGFQWVGSKSQNIWRGDCFSGAFSNKLGVLRSVRRGFKLELNIFLVPINRNHRLDATIIQKV